MGILSRAKEAIFGSPSPLAPGAGGLGGQPKERIKGLSPEVADFVYDGDLLIVRSSNVREAQYIHETGSLIVVYLNGDRWRYTINDIMAAGFAQATSKGKWIWSNVKIRGTTHDHQVPATKI